MNRYSPIAASLLLAAVLVPLLVRSTEKPTYAGDVIMAPEGGKLDALGSDGQLIGPCPLKHTDVNVDISGFFSRVTVTQRFYNRYDRKIEAVYTFPLSHRAAVDRMTMTVGDRVVVGEVKERSAARAIYEAARAQGYVASLLEQERPNIFTQSVANIEPGAEINIEISYVEMLQSKDGLYTFDFPMVVGPRYIPGSMMTPGLSMPDGLKGRNGVILMGPAKLEVGEVGDTAKLGTLQGGKLTMLLHNAVAIEPPGKEREAASGSESTLWYRFTAEYCDGSKELGTLHTDGTGQINSRWFYSNPAAVKDTGTGFASDTTQVPDASKITPMPVKPGQRAGHDIGLKITIDTGGPGIKDIDSALHHVVKLSADTRPDGLPRRVSYELMKADEIPNRDFVFNWRQTADTIQEATFAHTDKNGNFFTLILQPPQRVTDSAAVPRELVFVLDTSGSMSGFPVEKAKQVMNKAIDALRPQDTFNLITFAGDTHILWEKPRPANKANVEQAQAFLSSRQGGGGTEMMKAINAALVQQLDGPRLLTLEEMMNLPADGREVQLRIEGMDQKFDPHVRDRNFTGEQRVSLCDWMSRMAEDWSRRKTRCRMFPLTLCGHWLTDKGERVLVIDRTHTCTGSEVVGPMRIVCFMTDGYVGNDMEIIDAVKKNAATTRVFSFGIGNSVNRYLLDGMARAGRGEVEYVLLESDGDEAVQRFTRRIQTPVLTDIRLSFSPGVQVQDLLPTTIPDLFDAKPLVIHGRYTQPGKGTLTIRGNTGAGPWERSIDLDLPAAEPSHDVIATLWARTQVEEIMNRDLAAMQAGNFPEELQKQIIGLGEQFQIMTQFTSFVAVEKSRVTIGGQPMLVAVPIEMPQGVSYEGVFGHPGVTSVELGRCVLSEVIQTESFDDSYKSVSVDKVNKGLVTDSPAEDLRKKPGKRGIWKRQLAEEKTVETETYSRGGFGGGVSGAMPRGAASSSNLGVRHYGYYGGANTPAAAPKEFSVPLAPSLPSAPPALTLAETGAQSVHATRSPAPTQTPHKIEAAAPAALELPALEPNAGELRIMVAPLTSHVIVKADEAQREEISKWIEQLEGADAGPAASQPASTQPADAQMEALTAVLQMIQTMDAGEKKPLLEEQKLCEKLVLIVAAMVQENRWADATTLAQKAADATGCGSLKKLAAVLKQENVPQQKRLQKVQALAEKARAALAPIIRAETLRNRLTPELLEIAEKPGTKPRDERIQIVEGGLRVTVLAKDVETATLDALKSAGLKIEAVASPTKLVIGTVAADKLADVACVDAVRRIEPTH